MNLGHFILNNGNSRGKMSTPVTLCLSNSKVVIVLVMLRLGPTKDTDEIIQWCLTHRSLCVNNGMSKIQSSDSTQPFRNKEDLRKQRTGKGRRSPMDLRNPVPGCSEV